MIEVLVPGALTSVQTASGRPGWRHIGVPVGGAVDAWSARLANRLVDNPDDAALLEITLVGPALRFGAAARVALTGPGVEASVDGHARQAARPRREASTAPRRPQPWSPAGPIGIARRFP